MNLKSFNEKRAKATKIKKRYWSFIAYPESLPANWIALLEQTGLKIAISPLHNRDIIEGTQELKKPHYHVILCYDSPTTYENVRALTASLDQVSPKYIEGKEGVYFMHQYLTHSNESAIKDGKARYDQNEIIYLNNFNSNDYRVLTDSDFTKFKLDVIKFILERNILEYADLLIELMSYDLDLFEYASNHTILFDRFVSSLRHKQEKKKQEEKIEQEQDDIWISALHKVAQRCVDDKVSDKQTCEMTSQLFTALKDYLTHCFAVASVVFENDKLVINRGLESEQDIDLKMCNKSSIIEKVRRAMSNS